MNRMMAAILAGGRGTRMEILGQVRPKPALPFAGKFRVIDFCLSNCVHSRISDVAVLVDYQRAQITGYVRQWQNQNAVKSTFDILEPERNGCYSGTANALYQKLDYLRKHPADRVLIMPSDQSYKMDYRKMLAFHENSKADVTISVVPVPLEEAHRFGTIIPDGDGHVLEFVEKPEVPRSNLASMGIYIFNKDILLKRLIEDAAEPASFHDFGYSIIPRMVKRDRVYAYKHDGFWRDIGTIESYYAASMDLISVKPSFSVNGAWPVLTCENGEPVRISPSGRVENSIISPGCIIKGRVENSILSPGVHVAENAVVKNSIIMSDVSIGRHSVIDSCIADEDVNIGEFCYIGFGSDHGKTTECTLLGKGAAISSHTAIALGCKIMPYSSIAESVGKASALDYEAVRSKPSSLPIMDVPLSMGAKGK